MRHFRALCPGIAGRWRVRAQRALVVCATLAASAPALAYDWPQYNGNSQHSGNNTAETAITAANVNTLTLRYHFTLPFVLKTNTTVSVSDGAPVFADGVTVGGAVKDVLFITTKTGGLVAVDAQTGTQLWVSYFPDPSTCTSGECSNSSAVVDPNRLYVYTYGVDGYVHKVNIKDGTEVTGNGWPELTTTKPQLEKQSASLALATISGTTFLYSAISAHNGDGGDNQGHITTINLWTGTQNVFNMVCSDKSVHFITGGSPDCTTVLAGGWARPGAVYDASTNRLFVGTGNGHFDPGVHSWGDSIIALNPFGSGNGALPVDAYTPTNQQALDNGDTDLGSTAPALLPVPATSKFQHLAVQSGKDAKLRLLNLADLSGAGAPGNLGGEIGAIINVPQGGAVRTQPAVWVNPADNSTWVFVVNGNGAAGLQLAVDGSGNPSLVSKWHNGVGGASPLVANGVLYYAGSNTLYARDPATGGSLWSSTQIGGIHWQSPVVACGSVYVFDQSGQLDAFGLGLSRASVNGGNDQATPAGSSFANALSVRVMNAANAPVNGAAVTFQLPASGASAMFSGSTTTMTATTNASGIASVPAPTANTTPGSYIASANIAGGACAAEFHLANTATKFASLQPARLLDTRSGRTTVDGLFDGAGTLGAHATTNLAVLNRGGVPASGVSAVALNITVTNPTATGFVTVWAAGDARPTASNLNFVPGQSVANLVVVKVGGSGAVSLFNSAGNVDLIADVVGWFPTTSGLTALTPARVLDTRAGRSTVDGGFAGGGALGTHAELDLTVAGRASVPASGVGAVILNVTATGATAPGFLTAWPAGSTRPLASNINYVVGQTTPNLVLVQPGSAGAVALFNSAGSVDLVADVAGWFATASELRPLAPFRLLDTRSGGSTGDGQFAAAGTLGPGGRIDLTVSGRDGIPGSATAVVLNVTAVTPTADGFITVWPSGSLMPNASNINFSPGRTTPNLVIAGIGSDGKVSILNSAGSTDVVADVVGWFSTSP